ncbi:MAG: hypothetical protein ACQ9MH_21695 [Nitrospinales bacterium]
MKNASVQERCFTESLSALNNNTAPIIMNVPKKMIGKTRGEYEKFLILIINQCIKQKNLIKSFDIKEYHKLPQITDI